MASCRFYFTYLSAEKEDKLSKMWKNSWKSGIYVGIYKNFIKNPVNSCKFNHICYTLEQKKAQ